ncbi:MAG TPA: recombinase family protein [Ktedonobacteraceae bacterium]|nr:recombinase family protein [Ktedonobacteraceae bacterium]
MVQIGSNNSSPQPSPYRGQRALMLLRVSSPEQEKGFGWPAQEKEIRNKLLTPLGLTLDEQRHIIRDTYTGLEFRERPALNRILEMAQKHEFDILVTDVLDRLGRKGLARELYRMQLKELGVRILTTDPNDHADDDSLVGEMIRLIKGYQAEEELNNIRRRTMNGKRVKIEGNKDKGIAPVIGGNGHRYYGYKYILDERGKRIGISLNVDVIKVDEDGTEWTEVRVITYMFETAASGVTLRQIAKYLNEKGIPPPYAAKSVTSKNMRHAPAWQASAVSRLVRNSVYYGDARFYKKRCLGKVGGKKDAREITSEKEQVVVPVPAIVTKELAEKACKMAQRNKRFASRNNSTPEEFLLRGGLAKCGYCGGSLRTQPHHSARKDGSVRDYTLYVCGLQGLLDICKGCSILTPVLDNAAWEHAVEIIRDPAQVDAKVAAYKVEDPTAERRKNIKKKLAQIRQEQDNMEENLATLMRKGKLNSRTEERLTENLNQLAEQEQGYLTELARDEDTHVKWQKVQEKLDELHQICTDMREKLNDPTYTPSYQTKRDMLVFLGIEAIVWKKERDPKFEVYCTPPDIVSLLCSVGPQ